MVVDCCCRGGGVEKDEALTIKREGWTEEARALMGWAFPHMTEEAERVLNDIRGMVENDTASLFMARMAGVAVLACVLSVEGRQGVVQVAAGSLPGVDLTTVVLPELEKKFIGCDSVRIHTARAGLAKKLAGQGYAAKEIVLVKKL